MLTREVRTRSAGETGDALLKQSLTDDHRTRNHKDANSYDFSMIAKTVPVISFRKFPGDPRLPSVFVSSPSPPDSSRPPSTACLLQPS
jgi:hypothetical protein